MQEQGQRHGCTPCSSDRLEGRAEYLNGVEEFGEVRGIESKRSC